MGKLLFGVLLLVFWLWFQPAEWEWPDLESKEESGEVEAVTASSTSAAVAYVVDGDTIVLAGEERVRLLGIDTPEQGECYYEEASAYTRELLAGRTVRLEADATDRDKYDRLLRHVFVTVAPAVPEVHLNLRLVEEGYAVVLPIPPDRQYREELAAAQAAAKAAGKGRWGVCGG